MPEPALSWRSLGRLRGARGGVAIVLLGCIALFAGLRLKDAYRLHDGERALAEHNAELAQQLLEAESKRHPDDARTEFLLARTYRRLGDSRRFNDHLRAAQRLKYPVEAIERESILALAQAGQMRQVEPRLKPMLADPRGDAPEICEAFANGYLRLYQIEQALAIIEAWQLDFPADPQPHVLRAKMLEHKSIWKDAAEEFQRALELDPERLDVRYDLARMHQQLREYSAAMRELDRVLAESPKQIPAYINYAACLAATDRKNDAEQMLLKAAAMDPNNPWVELELGELYRTAGKNERAVEQLSRAVAQVPYSRRARYGLGRSLQALGRRDEARPHLEFAERSSAAIQEVNNLMDLVQKDPKLIEPRYKIGVALLKYSSPADGATWLESVLQLDPNHRGAHAALADYYAGRNNSRLADEHRRLAELAPQNPSGS